MPELVAGLVHGAGIRVTTRLAVVADVAEVDDLAGRAEGDVVRLRLARPIIA